MAQTPLDPFYHPHDPLTKRYDDTRSVVSQAYSQVPLFGNGANNFLPPHLGGGKKGTYSSYASSIVSQQDHRSEAASSAYNYKDDDTASYAQSNSGITEF